jgi:trans-4-hydroxy-L-proline dehydratase
MNQRIAQLRQQSLDATNRLTHERAMLLTKFYQSGAAAAEPIAVQRALAFRHIMLNKDVCILPGELIVGERGPEPKATPTYPEISLHSLDDLDVLHNRPKVSFEVSDETKQIYAHNIIPYWQGKTQRDRVFSMVSDAWKTAYKAGVFTEFQEQRAPGHTVAGNKLFRVGMLQLKNEIRSTMEALPETNDRSSKMAQLKAMEIAAQTIIDFAARYAEALQNLCMLEKNQERLDELIDLVRICRKVPAHAPETFHEALQHYWFIHVGVITELNPWDAFNPGRLDQHLLPFYQKDIADGSLDEARARELLQAFWIKFNNHPSPPKTGITALESNTYTDFALINLGGMLQDGSDAVNELTYILLDVIEEMRLLQPSSMVQVSTQNPDEFIKRALQITKTGFGQPSFFNADGIVAQLLRQGKSIADARNGGASGCVETGAFGNEAYTLSGYFNLNKVLEITLNNGIDPRTGLLTGMRTGEPSQLKTFDQLYEAFEKQLNYFIDIKLRGNNIIEKLYAAYMPAPFLSLLINDCIANATDYNAGGARYNTSYLQGVGLGSITDSFAAIRKWVFDDEVLTLDELRSVINHNFEGHETLRHQFIYNSPKWGNNNEYADRYANMVFDSFFKAVDGRPSARGGVFRINMLPTTSHVYFGSVIGAMPDGRLCAEPLSEGMSPVQGTDVNGPIAVLQSAAKIDHRLTGGTLLNQKFSPEFFDGDEAIEKLTALIRTWFRLGGHHIQFNVVDAHTLRQAQQQPEKYRDLIVRVAGYSDYFNDLGEALQEEIIRRTEHE